MSERETLVLAFTDAMPGKEDEFNEWYDTVHLQETADVEGWVEGERFQLDETQLEGWGRPTHKYLAIYRLKGDPATAIEKLKETQASGVMSHPGELLDIPGSNTVIYTSMGVTAINGGG